LLHEKFRRTYALKTKVLMQQYPFLKLDNALSYFEK
jgi:hypothetical protein